MLDSPSPATRRFSGWNRRLSLESTDPQPRAPAIWGLGRFCCGDVLHLVLNGWQPPSLYPLDAGSSPKPNCDPW